MSAIARIPERIHGSSLDWGMALLGLVFTGGLFLDGWAHNHGKVDSSFFTPWHAVLYSGWLLNFGALAGVALLNRGRGYGWGQALPRGYWLSLLGLGLWFIGGPGDLLWHTLFGIEENINALYSPTHLLLASGLVLSTSGAFRVMWARRESAQGLLAQLPMLLSLLTTLSVMSFFVQFAHPVSNPWGLGDQFQPEIYQATGVLSWLVITALLMGGLLLAIRRWRLAPGAFTLIFALNAFGMGFMERDYPTLLVLLFGGVGLLVDGLYLVLKPGPKRPDTLRLFAFLVPVLLSGSFFVAGGLTVGVAWSIHLAAGTVFLTGIVGIFLSLLVVPPAVPVEAE